MPLTVTERGGRPASETRRWRPRTDGRAPSVSAKLSLITISRAVVVGQAATRQQSHPGGSEPVCGHQAGRCHVDVVRRVAADPVPHPESMQRRRAGRVNRVAAAQCRERRVDEGFGVNGRALTQVRKVDLRDKDVRRIGRNGRSGAAQGLHGERGHEQEYHADGELEHDQGGAEPGQHEGVGSDAKARGDQIARCHPAWRESGRGHDHQHQHREERDD